MDRHNRSSVITVVTALEQLDHQTLQLRRFRQSAQHDAQSQNRLATLEPLAVSFAEAGIADNQTRIRACKWSEALRRKLEKSANLVA